MTIEERNQLFGEIKLSPQESMAIMLWRGYYLDTEAYDREVCSGRTYEGIAMPANGDELRRSSTYANLCLRQLEERAQMMGIPALGLDWARRHGLRLAERQERTLGFQR